MSNHPQQVFETDAVIIGGGLAGLSAAYAFNDSGLQVHLLEASERLGGRTWGQYWDEAQRHVDLGASWLTQEFHTALELVNDFGLTTTPTPTPSRYFTHFSNGVGEQQVPSADETEALRILSEDISSAIASSKRPFANAREALDAHRTSPFCRDWHLAMQRYLAGADLRKVDPGHLLLALDDLIDPEHYNIEIQGSMRQLVAVLENSVEAAVHRSTPVTAVRRKGDSYEVATNTNTTFHASAVVLAVPLNALANIHLDPKEIGSLADFVSEGHPGDSKKHWFILEGVDQHLRVFASEGLFGYFRTAGRLEDGTMLAVGLAPGHEGTPTQSELETQIQKYTPTAKILAHQCFDWKENPWVQGTWVTPPPGYYTALAELHDSPKQNFHIVGGDFCSDFPGTVEGAISTGTQAAKHLLRHTFSSHNQGNPL